MSKETKRILLQVGLFVVTLLSTTIAGAEWVYGKSVFAVEDNSLVFNTKFSWNDFASGLSFSIPFLLILTVHEFGHYFTAKYHKIRASLPYYIPFPPNPILPSIGTLGAVIRIRERVKSNLQNFDIGLAGPLAGFIMALGIIFYGYATLPPAEHIYKFHPEYKAYGAHYADSVYSAAYMEKHNALDLQIGSTLLFEICEFFVSDKTRIPNAHEMMHYPFLFAGFLALFFTSMNLLPIGQLDGGHITYGLFGFKGHKIVATVFFILLIFYSGLGIVKVGAPAADLAWSLPLMFLYYFICFGALTKVVRDQLMYTLIMLAAQVLTNWVLPSIEGYAGWLVFGFIVSRMVGVEHPHSEIEVPLDSKRVVLGWIMLIIFILSFSPTPLLIK
jgi:membrane-associated protease RseP (regulator of RpoE activity)